MGKRIKELIEENAKLKEENSDLIRQQAIETPRNLLMALKAKDTDKWYFEYLSAMAKVEKYKIACKKLGKMLADERNKNKRGE